MNRSAEHNGKGSIQPPFHKNDEVTLTIEDLGSAGEGIGRADGYTLFVKDALPGDTIRALITRTKPTYGYARLLKIETPSGYRTAAKCPVARSCGGCQIQEMEYAQQLQFKQRKVREDLIRIGGFDPKTADHVMHPIVGMEYPWRYRNKAQIPVGMRGGKLCAGFYAGRTHVIIPMEDCLISSPVCAKVQAKVLTWMERYHIPPYDETTGKGLVRHILVRTGKAGREIMVCLVINGRTLPHAQELSDDLFEIPGIVSFSVNINTERSNVILGRELRILRGRPYMEDELEIMDAAYPDAGGEAVFTPTGRSVRYRISPLSFYQVNPYQTVRLYSLALSFAGLTGHENVWDLYCGAGTISLFLAGRAGHVFGVEIIPQAIENARANARINGIRNAEFVTGAAEKVMPEYLREHSEDAVDTVVVDPPRKGCDIVCLQTILQAAPSRIVYVSCDPATLCRDLKILTADGHYRLQHLQPVDMFPQTASVENVCLLARK